MIFEKFWIVIDISENEDRYFYRHSGCNWPEGVDAKIPQGKAPTCAYYDVEKAERELLRLAQEHPNGEFIICESVSYAHRFENKIYGVRAIE